MWEEDAAILPTVSAGTPLTKGGVWLSVGQTRQAEQHVQRPWVGAAGSLRCDQKVSMAAAA